MRLLLFAIAAALFALPVAAQPINTLPAAATPISPSLPLVGVQAGAAVQVQAGDIVASITATGAVYPVGPAEGQYSTLATAYAAMGSLPGIIQLAPGTWQTNSSIVLGQGQSIKPTAPCVASESGVPSIIPCAAGGGSVIQAGSGFPTTGSPGTPVVEVYNSSGTELDGFAIDCNKVANCIALQYSSNNGNLSAGSSMNSFTNMTLMGCHHCFVNGEDLLTDTGFLYQADTYDLIGFQIFGNCSDPTAIGILINASNAGQNSTLRRGNIQCTNQGLHVVRTNGLISFIDFNWGSQTGTNKVFIQMDANAGQYYARGMEIEGGAKFCLHDSSAPSSPNNSILEFSFFSSSTCVATAPVNVSSGTYTSATGAVSLTLASGIAALTPGDGAIVAGLTCSAGSCTPLNQTQTATVGSGGTTLNYTIASGLGTITINGSTGTATLETGNLLDGNERLTSINNGESSVVSYAHYDTSRCSGVFPAPQAVGCTYVESHNEVLWTSGPNVAIYNALGNTVGAPSKTLSYFTATATGLAPSNIVAGDTASIESATAGKHFLGSDNKGCLFRGSTGTLFSCANGGNLQLGQLFASGTQTLGTASLSAGTCATVTTAVSNIVTTDVINWSSSTAPGTPDGQMVIKAYPTAGNVNFQECNPTAGSLTQAGLVLNYQVFR